MDFFHHHSYCWFCYHFYYCYKYYRYYIDVITLVFRIPITTVPVLKSNHRYQIICKISSLVTVVVNWGFHGHHWFFMALPREHPQCKISFWRAGEATSKIHFGTVHGAWFSGERQARRLLVYLGMSGKSGED
jgi:hypothetical protein